MATDAELVSKGKGGDEQALEELLGRYQNRLFSYLLRMLGNYHDAEEALQESFVKVIRSLEKYEERGFFRSWRVERGRWGSY